MKTSKTINDWTASAECWTCGWNKSSDGYGGAAGWGAIHARAFDHEVQIRSYRVSTYHGATPANPRTRRVRNAMNPNRQGESWMHSM